MPTLRATISASGEGDDKAVLRVMQSSCGQSNGKLDDKTDDKADDKANDKGDDKVPTAKSQPTLRATLRCENTPSGPSVTPW